MRQDTSSEGRSDGQSVFQACDVVFSFFASSTCSVLAPLPFSRAVSERFSSAQISQAQGVDAHELSRSSASDWANLLRLRISGPFQYILRAQ